MNRPVLILILLFLSADPLFSNPVMPDPYTMPGITEVYVPQPDDWYIELDGQWCLFDSGNVRFPCTTDLYLRIAYPNSSKIEPAHRARVVFKDNYYGVLSRSSLTGIDSLVKISITPPCTVMVARDTVKGSKYAGPDGQIRYWKFPVQKVASGNVLIAQRMLSDNVPEVVETSRKSIGYPGYYKTNCYLTMLDKHELPVTGVTVSRDSGSVYATTSGASSFRIETALNRPGRGKVEFGDPNAVQPYSDTTVLIPDYYTEYDDKDSVHYDTMRLDVTRYMLTVTDSRGDQIPGVNLFRYYPITGRDNPYRFCKIAPINNKTPATWLLRVYKSMPVDTLFLAWDTPSLCTMDPIDSLAKWSPPYSESADTAVYQTVIVDLTSVARQKKVRSSASMSVLAENNRSLLITVSSPVTEIRTATASLYTLDGRKISSEPVTFQAGTGTARLRFNNGESIARGAYFCRLNVGGTAVLSRRVIVP